MIPYNNMSSQDFVELKNETDTVKIHLHGATVISWTRQGKELLFLSSKALLNGSKPIRGGIPLVFRKANRLRSSVNSCFKYL